MKPAALQYLVAGVGLVAATPLRVIMISSHSEVASGLRFGMPVARINPDVAQVADPKISLPTEAGPQVGKGTMRHPCHFRQKAIGISNLFRKVLGLPMIENNPAPGSEVHGGLVRILPFVGTPNVVPVANDTNKFSVSNLPHPHRPHHHRPHHWRVHKDEDTSFLRRLHFALMALGPWEGRAVAFVLGCGIGVLLRMIWVLAVISYRSVRGQKEDSHEYSHIVCEYVDDAEEIFVAPPHYVLADEKLPIEEEAAQAPKPTV